MGLRTDREILSNVRVLEVLVLWQLPRKFYRRDLDKLINAKRMQDGQYYANKLSGKGFTRWTGVTDKNGARQYELTPKAIAIAQAFDNVLREAT